MKSLGLHHALAYAAALSSYLNHLLYPRKNRMVLYFLVKDCFNERFLLGNVTLLLANKGNIIYLCIICYI